MENYYEYLKLDMSCSLDDIKNALENAQHLDESLVRKMRSILLNEEFKKEYDKKLIDILINGEKKENRTSLSSPAIFDSLKELDNGELHDKYIHASIVLLLVNFIAPFIFSSQVYVVINFIAGLAMIFLMYKDWLILEKNNKATFSKWWAVFSPVYLYKRSNAKAESKKYFLIWMAVIIISVTSTVIFASSKSATESTACEIVSDIYRNQFHRPQITCKKVTITETEGKLHTGIAELSTGVVNDITIRELSDGQIYVTVDPN